MKRMTWLLVVLLPVLAFAQHQPPEYNPKVMSIRVDTTGTGWVRVINMVDGNATALDEKAVIQFLDVDSCGELFWGGIGSTNADSLYYVPCNSDDTVNIGLGGGTGSGTFADTSIVLSEAQGGADAVKWIGADTLAIITADNDTIMFEFGTNAVSLIYDGTLTIGRLGQELRSVSRLSLRMNGAWTPIDTTQTPSTGEVLEWNGTQWTPEPDNTGGGTGDTALVLAATAGGQKIIKWSSGNVLIVDTAAAQQTILIQSDGTDLLGFIGDTVDARVVVVDTLEFDANGARVRIIDGNGLLISAAQLAVNYGAGLALSGDQIITHADQVFDSVFVDTLIVGNRPRSTEAEADEINIFVADSVDGAGTNVHTGVMTAMKYTGNATATQRGMYGLTQVEVASGATQTKVIGIEGQARKIGQGDVTTLVGGNFAAKTGDVNGYDLSDITFLYGLSAQAHLQDSSAVTGIAASVVGERPYVRPGRGASMAIAASGLFYEPRDSGITNGFAILVRRPVTDSAYRLEIAFQDTTNAFRRMGWDARDNRFEFDQKMYVVGNIEAEERLIAGKALLADTVSTTVGGGLLYVWADTVIGTAAVATVLGTDAVPLRDIAADSITVLELLTIRDFALNVAGTLAAYDSGDGASNGDVLTWNTGNTLTWNTPTGGGNTYKIDVGGVVTPQDTVEFGQGAKVGFTLVSAAAPDSIYATIVANSLSMSGDMATFTSADLGGRLTDDVGTGFVILDDAVVRVDGSNALTANWGAGDFDITGLEALEADTLTATVKLNIADFLLNVAGVDAEYDSTDAAVDGQVLTWNTGNTLSWTTPTGSGAFAKIASGSDTSATYSQGTDTLARFAKTAAANNVVLSPGDVGTAFNMQIKPEGTLTMGDTSGTTDFRVVLDDSTRVTFSEAGITPGQYNANDSGTQFIGTAAAPYGVIYLDTLGLQFNGAWYRTQTGDVPVTGQVLHINTSTNVMYWDTDDGAGGGNLFKLGVDSGNGGQAAYLIDNDTVVVAGGTKIGITHNNQTVDTLTLRIIANSLEMLNDMAAFTSADLADRLSDEVGTGTVMLETSVVRVDGTNALTADWAAGDFGIIGLEDLEADTITATVLAILNDFELNVGGINALYDSTDVATNGQQLTWNTGNTLTWEDAGAGSGNTYKSLVNGVYTTDTLDHVSGNGISVTRNAVSGYDSATYSLTALTADWAAGNFDVTGMERVVAETLSVDAANTYVYEDGSNNMVFVDVVAGATTLNKLDAAADSVAAWDAGVVWWSNGSATPSGTWDLGALTALEIPNSALPNPTNVGHLFMDSDDFALIGTNATDDHELTRRLKWAEVNIDDPDNLVADTVVILWVREGPFPSGIIIDSVYFLQDQAASYTVTFIEGTDMNSGITTIEALTASTEEAANTTAIDLPTIETGNVVMAVMPATDRTKVTVGIAFHVPVTN